MKQILSPSSLIMTIIIALLVCCQSFQLEKKLSPEEQEFLSKVRFIITRKERNTFLRLPPSERRTFIEQFWAKRDSDPETEINEYKEEYFSRIEQANRLFRGEGTPGWLTDRGRIYILFGSPYSRKIYPSDAYGGIIRASEVWYYGNFPVVFVDRYNSGVYTLETTNLAALNEINFALRQMREETEKLVQESTEILFDFGLELEESSSIPVLLIKVPYKKIWFKARENVLETTLNLDIKILDAGKKIVLQHTEEYPVSLTEKELERKSDKDYIIEIPLLLAEGDYLVQATLANRTGDEKVHKEYRIRV